MQGLTKTQPFESPNIRFKKLLIWDDRIASLETFSSNGDMSSAFIVSHDAASKQAQSSEAYR